MRKIWGKVLLSMAVILCVCMPVCAAELEQVRKDMVLETIDKADLLEKPETTARTVITLQAGTVIVVLEDEKDGWCKVSGQEQTGYVEIAKLKTLGDREELNAEFDKISNTVQLVFDEIMVRENEEKQARIWGTIIVVLIVAIFGVGIVSAVRKNKSESKEGSS